jgi:hypothetical protein
LLKTSIYIQIVIRWASIHRLSICIIDLPTTGFTKSYDSEKAWPSINHSFLFVLQYPASDEFLALSGLLFWEKLSAMAMLERCMFFAVDTWLRAFLLRQIKIPGKSISHT